jgi:transcriptional regulator with XRE-family HTH domain
MCGIIFSGGDNMHDRLKSIRKDHNMTQDAFAAEIGASRGMIAKYETGLVIPDKPIRLLICEKFNVNPVWLETGEGVPYKEGLIPALASALQNMPSVAAALERLLPKLTPDDFRHINEMVSRIIDGK